MKYKKHLHIITVLFAIILLGVPSISHAGLWGSIGKGASSIWDRVSSYMRAGTIGYEDEEEVPTDDGDEEDVGDGGESEPGDSGEGIAVSVDEGMCRVPQQQPETICEPGAGFLCVNTPDRGVATDWAIVKGTVDRSGSVVANISVMVQHEYTKETVGIDTTDPETEACWDNNLDTRPFCLDEEGYFAARIPLSRLGAYTVSVSASRLSGNPQERSVRLSRVEAPTLSEESISYEPDILTDPQVTDDVVSVIVELIGDCQFCDFIGASVGAVTVTVENTMVDGNGSIRHISCATNIEQGGQGRFVIGVPAGPGNNALTVTVCNAAVEGACPSVSGMKFTGPEASGGFEVLNPPPQPAYDSSEYPDIDWEFRVGGLEADACVNLFFNRMQVQEVCASNGVFRTTLDPSPGINVATVEVGEAINKKVYPWTFGWGKISTPFDRAADDEADEGIIAERAFQLALPSETLTKILQPVMSNFLASDSFGDFVVRATSPTPPARTDEEEEAVPVNTEELNSIKASLTGCSTGGGFMDGKRLEVVGSPIIGSAKIQEMVLKKDELSFSINTDHVTVRIRLVIDGDGDGVPDRDPIPLLIAFRKAFFDIVITSDVDAEGRPLLLISSPHTDCDYKSKRYCTGMPASLIPQYFVGGATPIGGFVKCDTEGQQVSKETKEVCEAMNSLNAYTGVVSEKVLDAVNSTLYCTGSAVLTQMLRGSARGNPVRVGCFPDDPDDELGAMMGCTSGVMGQVLGPWQLSMGFALDDDGVHIDGHGIYLTGGVRVGRSDLFGRMDEELRHPSVGVMVDPKAGAALPITAASSDSMLKLALSTDAINHILFLLTEQSHDGTPSGLLDLNLSEAFFKKLGFDFVEQCDAFDSGGDSEKKQSPLCTIRPRVGELLGTSLSAYKYFPQNYPVMMGLRGNRALAPHLKVVSLEDLPVVTHVEGVEEDEIEEPDGNLVEFQLGGVQLKFFALEVDEDAPIDEYGNLSVVLDENGDPIIKSMRPEEPDVENGQIISFDLTLLLALEFGDVQTDPDDPRRFIMKVRPLADRSRLVLTPVPGSNSTTVPPEGLVSALRQKLSYAISIFSAKEKAIKIPIPKVIALAPDTPSPDSMMAMLGLRQLTLGADGLALDWDENNSFLTVDLDGTIRQIIRRGGVIYEQDLPY